MPNSHLIRENFVLLSATLAASTIHYFFQFSMGRLLGPAEYGVLAALFSVIYIAIAPLQAVQLTLTKFVAELKAAGKFSEIRYLFDRSIKKIFFLSILVFALLALFSGSISGFLNLQSKSIVVQFSFIFLAIFVLAAVRGFMQGMQNFKALGANLVLESAVKFAGGLVLVMAGLGLAGAVWGLNASIFVSLGVALLFVISLMKKHGTKASGMQASEIYKYSIPTLIALSVVTVLYSIDVLLVKHFFPPADAGAYAAAALVAKVIFFALLPISQVMFPKIAEMKTKKEDYSPVFLKSVVLVAALSAVAIAVYFVAPDFVLTFLFGKEYSAAIPLIGLFGLAIGFLSVSYVFINYFLATGKSKFVYALPAFVVLEAALIWLFHSALYQVVVVIAAVMALMAASLVAAKLLSKG